MKGYNIKTVMKSVCTFNFLLLFQFSKVLFYFDTSNYVADDLIFFVFL